MKGKAAMTTIPNDKIQKDIFDTEGRVPIFYARLPELLATHPDEWVAFVEGDEWFFAETLSSLLNELDAKGKRRDTALIRSLASRRDILIL